MLDWGTHQIFFVPHQTAKVALSPHGSPLTACPQLKPLVTPSLNPDNISHHRKVSLLFWCHLKQDHTSSLLNWRLRICTQLLSRGSKPSFRCEHLLSLLGKKKKNLNFVERDLWLPQPWIAPTGTLRPSPGWLVLPHWERKTHTSAVPKYCTLP